MSFYESQPNILTISDSIDLIEKFDIDIEHNEVFTIGYEEIAIANISNKSIAIHKIPNKSTIIGQQRTPVGWQYLCQDELRLTCHCLCTENVSKIELEGPFQSLKTTSWSSCGKYVAVGSIGTTLSVWDTQTGKLVMQNSINWDNEEEFINPPTLSVTGWSETGKEIITIAKEIISSSIIIWDFETNKIATIIQ